MNVDFYFDPSCPYCWVTSRWLLMVSNQRDLTINWRLFSLAFKNGELEKDQAMSEYYYLHAHRVERVMLAAAKQGASLTSLYTTFGIKHFISGDEYTDEIIKSSLEQLKLDPSMLRYADDKSLDSDIIASTNEALAIVGGDIGVPTIVFTNKTGKKLGYFGPVILTLPEIDEAVEMWDGLVKLVDNPYLYELKRGRPESGPDVFSTSKC